VPDKGSFLSSSAASALDASVLVLNKLFMAVHIISVRRAFCLLCKDLAEVVSLEDGQFLTYDFATWRELSEYRARHFRQSRWEVRADCCSFFALPTQKRNPNPYV
jgi:hypothetical protein